LTKRTAKSLLIKISKNP